MPCASAKEREPLGERPIARLKPRAPLFVLPDDGDMRQVSVLFRVVEAVADDEAIFDCEADVFDLHVDLAPRRLAEEARRAKRFRVAAAQNVLEIMQRQTGVDDVFDDDDVAAL